MRKYCTIAVALGIVVAIAATATATTPKNLNYQGILTDAGGNPITTTVNVRFRIYGQPAGGAFQYDETQTVTPDGSGRINVELGIAGSFPALEDAFAGPDRWLGVTVGGDPEMTPRVHFTSVPYAFRVETVDGATGGSISGDVSVGGTVHITGTPGVDGVEFPDNTIQTTAATASPGGVIYTPGNTWRYTANGTTNQTIPALVPSPPGPFEARYITGIWLNSAYSANFTAAFSIAGTTILRLDDEQINNGSQQFWLSGGGAPIILLPGESLTADVNVSGGTSFPWQIIVTGYDQ